MVMDLKPNNVCGNCEWFDEKASFTAGHGRCKWPVPAIPFWTIFRSRTDYDNVVHADTKNCPAFEKEQE